MKTQPTCDACKKNDGICAADKAGTAWMEKVLDSDVIVPVPPEQKIVLATADADSADDPQYNLIRQQIEFIRISSSGIFSMDHPGKLDQIHKPPMIGFHHLPVLHRIGIVARKPILPRLIKTVHLGDLE